MNACLQQQRTQPQQKFSIPIQACSIIHSAIAVLWHREREGGRGMEERGSEGRREGGREGEWSEGWGVGVKKSSFRDGICIVCIPSCSISSVSLSSASSSFASHPPSYLFFLLPVFISSSFCSIWSVFLFHISLFFLSSSFFPVHLLCCSLSTLFPAPSSAFSPSLWHCIFHPSSRPWSQDESHH